MDGVKDASDKLIGKVFINSVEAASTLNVSLSELIVKAAAGSYNLIVVADVDNYITETDETNNTYVVAGLHCARGKCGPCHFCFTPIVRLTAGTTG